VATLNSKVSKTTAQIKAGSGLNDLIKSCKERIERTLDTWLPPPTRPPVVLHQAMRYAALAGGKYIRPLLIYATGKTLNVTPDRLDGPACAVELIHAYSLVHDDLPAMDNDELRRGKPACHKAFGEAVAILTGDALQSLAFHILAHDMAIGVSALQRLQMIQTLTTATGSMGMAGGQAIDLAAVDQSLTIKALEYMHELKTGALIRACIRLGCLSTDAIDKNTASALDNYATCIGLAFQIRDDILDIEGSTAVLGKKQGADIAKNKPTYPALLGMDGAKRKAEDLHQQAITYLEPLGSGADPLRWISSYIVQREN
jgi:geranylgeranyl diphosphate synthase, type II